MTSESSSSRDERVLVLMPTQRDAERTREFLQKGGMSCCICADSVQLSNELRAGAGAVLLAEEPLLVDGRALLQEALRAQPPWSSIPLILLVREGMGMRVESLLSEATPNVTLVERPVRMRTLLSVVHSALRARRHQYEARDALAEREANLKDAARRKDEFLATLAHELRNPLAPIRTGLGVLKQAPAGEAAVKAREMMDRQLVHMVRLIDDLLDLSRISRDKVQLKRQRVALRTIIETGVEGSRPLLDGSGHALEVSLPEEPIWMDVDPTRMAQVISNVLNNAAKYTPSGGRISVHARREGDEAVIRIADNGVGIPPEQLREVFDMFSQVNRTLARSQGGLGIGLAIVRKLLDLHGGSVNAESEGLGRGSTFTIRLPTGISGRVDGGRVEEQVTPAVDTRRILVVDDNADAAECLSLLLEISGHRTRTAHDGFEALSTADDFEPEVVFLDIGLPDIDGYEVAKRLRSNPVGGRATLVAVTGWGTEEDKRKAKAAGFDYHLTKPVESTAIEAVLARVSQERRAANG